MLQQLAELITIDEIDLGHLDAADSRFASAVYAPVVSKPLSPRSLIAPRKSRAAPEPTLPI
jgi:hypothetical protein